MAAVPVLVIGLGSAGSRHAGILRDQGCEVLTVSRRTELGDYSEIAQAVRDCRPGHAVIASETAEHSHHLQLLREIGFSGPVLVEKPLFRDRLEVTDIGNTDMISVGYNLRFDPVLIRFQELLARLEEPVVSARIEVGQYLPEWRRARVMEETYSASAKAGGGVLRDLSHELDLSLLLFGPWKRLSALGGRLGGFDISSDDSWAITAVMERCPQLSLQMNYLDRPARRRIRVNCTHQTMEADLIAGRILINENVEAIGRRDLHSYEDQMAAFMGGAGRDRLCGYEAAMDVMEMIDEVERANQQRIWIERGAVA